MVTSVLSWAFTAPDRVNRMAESANAECAMVFISVGLIEYDKSISENRYIGLKDVKDC
jgi:hypothetical protein